MIPLITAENLIFSLRRNLCVWSADCQY